jgi:hypothetical protein
MGARKHNRAEQHKGDEKGHVLCQIKSLSLLHRAKCVGWPI